jgi:prophage regulatory protein
MNTSNTTTRFDTPAKSDFTGHMPTRFIRRKEVCHLTGLSPSSVYLLMNQNKFPQSIKLPGGKSVAWLLSDVEAWQRQTLAANSKAA